MHAFGVRYQSTFSAVKPRVVARGQNNETNPIIIWKRLRLARFLSKNSLNHR